MGSLRETIRTLLAAATVCLALSACTDGVVFDTYRHVHLAGWDKADTLFYDVPPMRKAGHYVQTVNMRVNDSFLFTGVTLVIDRTVEPEHRTYSDTLKCQLADNKGNTLGQGVNYYHSEFTVSEFDLAEGDSLHIGVRHIMKRETLPGIADIGLRLSLKQ